MNFSQIIETFMRHPIHVPVVHFPIALSFLVPLAALLALWRKSDPFYNQALFSLLILLVLSIFPAMGTGIYENVARYNGSAPNAPIKIAAGVALLLITIVLSLWRWRKPNVMQSASGILFFILSAICPLLAIILGFLGGIIVWGA